jgi:hypothetical protein
VEANKWKWTGSKSWVEWELNLAKPSLCLTFLLWFSYCWECKILARWDILILPTCWLTQPIFIESSLCQQCFLPWQFYPPLREFWYCLVIFGCHQQVVGVRIARSLWIKDKDTANILQCRGPYPTTQNCLAQMWVVPVLRNFALDVSNTAMKKDKNFSLFWSIF